MYCTVEWSNPLYKAERMKLNIQPGRLHDCLVLQDSFGCVYYIKPRARVRADVSFPNVAFDIPELIPLGKGATPFILALSSQLGVGA
jgi:hypothetical protein